MLHVLIIGGSGKQAAAASLPVILDHGLDSIQLVAIADTVAPDTSPFTSSYMNGLHDHGTFWVALNGTLAVDLNQLDKFLASSTIDTVIISSPPHTHSPYIKWALLNGLDVICDKPVIAKIDQSGDPAAPNALMQEFMSLCNLLERSVHRKHTGRRCYVYVPLMRRVSSPYNEIADGLREVFELTGQYLTHMFACRSDGCFRFAEEHDRPGAHGFRLGLGTLTMTRLWPFGTGALVEQTRGDRCCPDIR